MKSVLILATMVFSLSSMASPLLNTKERVRIELWYGGIESEVVKKEEIKKQDKQIRLPVELEHSLHKL